ncbi:MAG: glycosyltransferase family 2 protein [Magnetococcus sp. DMHC-6]
MTNIFSHSNRFIKMVNSTAHIEGSSVLITVVIPTLNEERFIGRALDSLINQTISDKGIEILVVDGYSTDKTREIVAEYAKKYSHIKLLDNPEKKTPYAFNIGIKNAHPQSQYITFLNGHGSYEETRFEKLLNGMETYHAKAAGGRSVAINRDKTPLGRCIALALASRFGTGGGFRVATDKPKIVDTASGCIYDLEFLKKVGLFNTNLISHQDFELNKRVRNLGGKIILIPDVCTTYYSRSDFVSFVKHNFRNGFWIIAPFRYTNVLTFSIRHLVPFIFVLSLLLLPALAFFSSYFMIVFYAILVLYSIFNIVFSIKTLFDEKNIKLFFHMFVVFATLHLTFGLGSLFGLLDLMLAVLLGRVVK